MKKKLLLLFVAILTLTVAGTLPVYAAPAGNCTPQQVSVAGIGRVEVVPDYAELTFCIQLRARTLAEGSRAITAKYNSIVDAIRTVDKNAAKNTVVEHTCAYPVCENGLSAFEFNLGFRVKTGQYNSTDQIIAKAGDAGVTRYNGTRYLLDDNIEALNRALTAAKENACLKATALQSGLKMTQLCENYVNVSQSLNANGRIVVESHVTGVFEL